MSSLVITVKGCGPSISVLLILEPVTLILDSSTSSPLADEAEDELSAGALGASLAVSATTSSAASSA